MLPDPQPRQTGTTIVHIAMSPPGVVNQLTLPESSGNASLDAAAMRAAVGVCCDGLEQPAVFLQPYEFDLLKEFATSGDSGVGASNQLLVLCAFS